VSYFQYFVLTPLPAGPAKLADQTFAHDVEVPAANVGAQAAQGIASNKHIITLTGHFRHEVPTRTLLPPVGFREPA
jgi:hypothetical protein